MQIIVQFLASLGTAASSWRALIAYCVVVIAWTVVTWLRIIPRYQAVNIIRAQTSEKNKLEALRELTGKNPPVGLTGNTAILTWVREQTGQSSRFMLLIAYVLTILAIVVVITIAIEHYKGPETACADDKLEKVDALCSTERQYYAPVSLRTGKPAHTKLADYYVEVNAPIFSELTSLVDQYNRRKPQDSTLKAHYGMSIIYAPAGVGKSTFVRDYAAKYPSLFYSIALDNLRKWHAELTELRPDLKTEAGVERTFSWLPALKDPKITFEDLLALFNDFAQHPKPFIVVDSLDEVHPDTSLQILTAVEQFLESLRKHDDHGFTHVIVVGRPEAFYQFLVDTHPNPDPDYIMYRLEDPLFKTDGDVKFMIQDYAQYWKRPPVISESEILMLLHRPFLLRSVSNLSIRNALFQDRNAPKESDEQTKEDILKAMMDRDKRSHGRPGNNSEDYLYLLEKAAAYYANKSDLGPNGEFIVSGQDAIHFTVRSAKEGESCAAVNASDLLSYSGLVFLDPADTNEMSFRFSPLWLHRFLTEKYNRRIAGGDPGIHYHGCRK